MRNQLVLRQNDPSTHVFIVKEGDFEISKSKMMSHRKDINLANFLGLGQLQDMTEEEKRSKK
jgi:hypothetical protein